MTGEFSYILLFGVSGGEIIIILVLVLLLFGPKRIPEIARTIGKGINEIKKVQRDINAEIHRYSEEIEKPAKQINQDIDGFKKGLYNQDDYVTPNDVTTGKTGDPVSGNSYGYDGVENDNIPYAYNPSGATDDDPATYTGGEKPEESEKNDKIEGRTE